MTNVTNEAGTTLKKYTNGCVQDELGLEGCHPSFENYSKDLNYLIDRIKERGVQKLFCGFAKIPKLSTENRSEVGLGDNGFQSRFECDNTFICFLSALLEPENPIFFKSDWNEYNLPNEHQVHYVSDTEVKNKTYRPYITPSCGCSSVEDVFHDFGRNMHSVPGNAVKRYIECMPLYDHLLFAKTLEKVMKAEFYTPVDHHTFTSLWVMDTKYRRVKRLTHMGIAMNLQSGSFEEDGLEDNRIGWNINTFLRNS